jgi:thioesterase domain-containing protein
MSEAWPHLHILKQGTDAPALVLIPGLLGYGICFQHLAAAGPAATQIAALNLPGADQREAVLSLSIETMADILEPQICAVVGKRPVIFGGFSLGAMLAYEFALRWQSRREPVLGMASFDGSSPGYTARKAPIWAKLLSHARSYRADPSHLGRALRNAASDTLSRVRLEWLLAENLEQSRDSARARRSKKLAALRIRAERSYVARATSAGPMLLIRIPRGEQASGLSDEPDYGWRQYVRSLEIHPLSGKVTHATFFDAGAQRPEMAEVFWAWFNARVARLRSAGGTCVE